MIFWWGSVWTLGKKDNEREETFFHRFCPSIGIDKHYFLSKLDQLSFPDIVLWGFNSIHFLLVKLLSLLLTYLESESISHSVMSDSLRPRGLYSPLCSSVHRIPQAGILEWVDIPFSKWSSRPKPGVLHFRQILYHLSHQGSPPHLYYLPLMPNSKALSTMNPSGSHPPWTSTIFSVALMELDNSCFESHGLSMCPFYLFRWEELLVVQEAWALRHIDLQS